MPGKVSVPYLDLTKAYGDVSNNLEKAFLRVIKSGKVVLGREVEDFERKYAAFSGTKYCAGVGSGLDALILALSAIGVGEGDEVLVPSNTYIATFIAVSRLGAVPIPVEPDINSFNIDPGKIITSITKKTKAIIPVHLYGQPCDMDPILIISKKHSIQIVEDNAQSHGASYKNKTTGSFGLVNATSFYPGKNLGAIGEGGAVTTNNKKIIGKIKSLRNYGESKRYENEYIGYNSRLDEIQAAFLSVQLSRITKRTARKRKIASAYIRRLKGVGDIVLPKTIKGAEHVYHIFAIRTRYRNKLRSYLMKRGIVTLVHYPIPVHLQKAYDFLGYKKGQFPIVEELAKTELSLPIFPEMSDGQLEHVIKNIKGFFK
jgi:dTDP-4-amino-4,6-dideoxygalactose transaminase